MKTTESHLQIKSTEDGINIDGSILWLDSNDSGEISFLSSIHLVSKAPKKQIIVSRELSGLLESQSKTLSGLVVDYNRQFAIGKYFIELLPSGSGVGDSIFLLSSENEKLLYAPKIQLEKIIPFRQLQAKEADTLILGAYFPFSSPQISSRKREKEKLLESITNSSLKKRVSVIVCDQYSTAPEMIELLNANQIAVKSHIKIQKTINYYRDLGYDIEAPTKISKNHQDNEVYLVPNVKNIKLEISSDKFDVVHVASIPFESFKPINFGEQHTKVFLPNCSYGRNLKEFINKVSPKKIYFHGPYAKEYETALGINALPTDSLFPNHLPSLF